MNSAALEPPVANTSRWLFWLSLIFLAQLVLIYLLSSRGSKTAPLASIPAELHIFSERLTEAQFSELFLVSDPALFASANTHGFSGSAWLKTPTGAYDQNQLFQRTEQLFWLPLNVAQFGTSLRQFLQTNSIASVASSDMASPPIQFMAIAGSASKTNSTLTIQGDLASRELFNPVKLQSWGHSELLSNSVAQITVDKQGSVLSARLLSRSGSSDADNNALEIAVNLQFAPVLENEITVGNLIFDWHTIPLVMTNFINETPGK